MTNWEDLPQCNCEMCSESRAGRLHIKLKASPPGATEQDDAVAWLESEDNLRQSLETSVLHIRPMFEECNASCPCDYGDEKYCYIKDADHFIPCFECADPSRSPCVKCEARMKSYGPADNMLDMSVFPDFYTMSTDPWWQETLKRRK